MNRNRGYVAPGACFIYEVSAIVSDDAAEPLVTQPQSAIVVRKKPPLEPAVSSTYCIICYYNWSHCIDCVCLEL